MDRDPKRFAPNPQLIQSSCVESKDELEEKFQRYHMTLLQLSDGSNEKEFHDKLSNAICKDKIHEEMCLGLLMSILTHPDGAALNYRDLTLLSRDGMAIVVSGINQIILDRYSKLTDVAREQILWLVREMMKTDVANIDGPCSNLLRYAAGGDISQRNLVLIDSLLDIFQENRAWLDRFPVLVASVVYTYLRLIEDHTAAHLVTLRQKEVSFIITLIREKMVDCLVIGRDFIRLLQNVSRIPEFGSLWKDIFLDPKSLHPNFIGVVQLLSMRTSRRFLQSRLTPDMEKKLVFLTSQVRFGNHKRYQEWFQRQYLATPESQTLRCDLIRFIVGVIHPTNELLCSDIIPRWAVIGWLFTTCTVPVAAGNAKLALFYDWLFFDSERDNIMNIEPAILVMQNSMRSHPAVTATLLDFLCRIIPNFYPDSGDKVRQGIFSSLKQILEKRVLPRLSPLFDNPKIDHELRARIKETFKDFASSPVVDSGNMEDSSKRSLELSGDSGALSLMTGRLYPGFDSNSSDEEETEVTHLRTELSNKRPVNSQSLSSVILKPAEDRSRPEVKNDHHQGPHIELEPAELKRTVDTLFAVTDNELKCQMMEQIVQMIIEDRVESNAMGVLVQHLSGMLLEEDGSYTFPINYENEENLLDSISTPLFVIFRNQYQLCKEEDDRVKFLTTFLIELQTAMPQIGYLFLYFLEIWCRRRGEREGRLSDTDISTYDKFCAHREGSSELYLIHDLERCHEDSAAMFFYILPDMYRSFKDRILGNSRICHLVVSTIDPSQLQDYIWQIMQGKFRMLNQDSLIYLLDDSANWESLEQHYFWQIFLAHRIPLVHILPLINHLRYSDHAETLTPILLILAREKPTSELLTHLLSRQDTQDDLFVITVLKNWDQNFGDLLEELLTSLLSTRFPILSPGKRKRTAIRCIQSPVFPTGEQILNHLNKFRQHYRDASDSKVYGSEAIRKALLHIFNTSPDLLKESYGDLFAIVEIRDRIEPTCTVITSSTRKQYQSLQVSHVKGGIKKNSPTLKEKLIPKRAATKDKIVDGSDQSSGEETTPLIKHPRKRKKMNVVGSDSD